MDKYENLGTIGEGTYGVVIKCRNIETGQIVAIKKFKESDEDEQVRKTAMREIKLLKKYRHENIVNLIEVFRRRGKLYLVFEYVDRTLLELLEDSPQGLEPLLVRKLMYQLVRAIEFCHSNNIIHRDIKPENLLISKNGVLKLCDFGFARPINMSGANREVITDYVSTRWYRSIELLVGDVSYGKGVDVWAIGCMLAEMINGMPLFPGESDIDQVYHIVQCTGGVTARQKSIFEKNSLYKGVTIPTCHKIKTLASRFPEIQDKFQMDFMERMLVQDPIDRITCAEMLQHPYLQPYADTFQAEVQVAIEKESFSFYNQMSHRSNISSSSSSSSKMMTQQSPTTTPRKSKKSAEKKKKREKTPPSSNYVDNNVQQMLAAYSAEKKKKKKTIKRSKPDESKPADSLFYDSTKQQQQYLCKNGYASKIPSYSTKVPKTTYTTTATTASKLPTLTTMPKIPPIHTTSGQQLSSLKIGNNEMNQKTTPRIKTLKSKKKLSMEKNSYVARAPLKKYGGSSSSSSYTRKPHRKKSLEGTNTIRNSNIRILEIVKRTY